MKPETLLPDDPPDGADVPPEVNKKDATDVNTTDAPEMNTIGAPKVVEADEAKHEPETSVFDTLHDLDPGFKQDNEPQQNDEYDGTADGFHGRKIDRPPSGAFLTSVDDPNKVYDELGIYEDTDVGDDLSDSELELERLRTEKLQREKEDKERQAAEELKRQRELFEKQKAARDKLDDPLAKYERFLSDSLNTLTPRTDVSSDSKMTIQTWTDPRLIQGLSIKELHNKINTGEIPVASSMKTEIQQSRNASRLALESREAMFRRAMTLLSARCTSVRQTSELEGDKLNIGGQVPKYFYVTQDKPLPMEPLKAWRGYHGNIYFEPININPLQSDLNSARAQTSVPRQNTEPALRTRTSVPKVRRSIDKENRPIMESRSESRQTNKSSGSLRSSNNRHMVYLDKQSVLNRLNDSIHEDIVWLEGTENTGSLAVRPKTFQERPTREKERDLQYNKERIRKGSVAHKLFIENRSKQKPRLAVNGDKFTPPHSLSPLLRTQTQYSLSSQRLTTNSPDPYHLNDSKLPPIDQIRVSLKHMDSRRDSGGPQRSKVPYNRPVTITDDMKPFVKYSPDVVAKMSQQTNIC